MQNSNRYKKGTLICSLGIFFNILLSVLLFAGANFVANDSKLKSEELIKAGKKEGIYVAHRLMDKFGEYLKGADDKELREEDPSILASQYSYDVLNYDLELSFDIEAKTISGDLYMHASSVNDT